MEQNSLLTFFRKYSFLIFLLSFLLILSGCSNNFTPVDSIHRVLFTLLCISAVTFD